jgi:DNA polymerase elongation subunit (family B)
MYADRVIYKKKMIEAQKEYEKTKNHELQKDIARYHNMQLAKKIQLNSAYGALGNEWFRWFDIDNAEAITTSGRISTRFIEMKLNEYLNELLGMVKHDFVIAADTDSIYLCLDPFIEKLGLSDKDAKDICDFLDKAVHEKFEKYIAESYQELADTVNAYAQKMRMKRETIADKGIWKARKMYILNALDVEGVRYSEPQIKMKGIEAVRSSTPMVVKDAIKKSLFIIMNKNEEALQEYVQEFKAKFKTLSFKDIARPSTVNNIDKYTDRAHIYKKGTPIHVRGALLYNHYIKQKGLESKYELITEGTKIKYIALKVPNPIRENIISVADEFPPELGLEGYIDFDTQFTKTFQDPITNVADIIGWKTEKTSSLLDFI